MPSKLERTLQKIDEQNSRDPNIEYLKGEDYPKELLYSKRMTEMAFRYEPAPSIPLQIAARGQHLRRWEISRKDYSPDRVGYLKWRTELKKFHANQVGKIMQEVGFAEDVISTVCSLIQKEGLGKDSEAQTLEDIICFVFLEFYFEDFSKSHAEEKIISIVQKTWKKMSKKGQVFALGLPLSDGVKKLLAKSLEV